jgi:hypothetical protein
MKSTPRNSIPINEWINNFDRIIHPIQSGEFDLTPILRARYGNLLSDDIVSVRLYAERRNVVLIISESGNTNEVIVDFSNTRVEEKYGPTTGLDDLFFLAAPDAPERDAKQEERQDWYNRMLSSLLWLFDSNKTAKYLPIFTTHYLALLERIQLNDDAALDLIDTETRLENTELFYKNCVEALAEPLQKQAINKVLVTLATKMKHQEASGIINDDLKTYWDEMGVIADQGSDNGLYNMLCNELEADVYYAIKELSEGEQFALWFFGDEVNSNLARWFDNDFEGVTLEGIKKDFSKITEDIRGELLGMATNELSPEATKYLNNYGFDNDDDDDDE